MSVLKIKDADGNWVGVTAIKGEKGLPGISPKINVTTNTNTTYKLRIQTEDREFITPNLKGGGGNSSSGNNGVDPAVGTIINYKEFDGRNIPTYNDNMPPLQCFRGGTTYVFEREVTFLVYFGEIDANGNMDIDKYGVYTGSRITVPTTYNGYLVDYAIYNPIPKKEWDTWENPNIFKIINHMYNGIGVETAEGTIAYPNLKITNANKYFGSGSARITNTLKKDIDGSYYIKKGLYDIAVYNRSDFPFILDEYPRTWDYNDSTKEFSNPVEIPYPGDYYEDEESYNNSIWSSKEGDCPAFAKGRDRTLQHELNLSACLTYTDSAHGHAGKPYPNGNKKLMPCALREKEMLAKEGVRGSDYDRCYDMVIAKPEDIRNHLANHEAQPIAPVMYVGLAPLHNYTIESTAGDCAIIFPNSGGFSSKLHITKEEHICYPTTSKISYASKNTVNSIGLSTGMAGVVTGSNKLNNGTAFIMEQIDNTKDPEEKIEIPCALTCPDIYLKKGESYTFQIEDEDDMYGIWVCCWQEEDYEGIKIVEGIESYSSLMYERIASGATKFNMKIYADSFDANEIMQEYNIRLADNTTEADYCRYLTNETIKNYDLDVFSMSGHKHTTADITDIDELKATIPKMILSTGTLVDGLTELAENTFHFVYEE